MVDIELKTLPDFLPATVAILSVGLNPSPNSVRCGYPFATPQNRFWRALNRSELVSKEYPPSVHSMHALGRDAQIGFTDLVKRPTPGAADLRASDYREWGPLLRDKIYRLSPHVVWFHGKVAYQNFVHYGLGARKREVPWGLQDTPAGECNVFVTPNPSPANAVYSLDDIVAWYDRLASYLTQSQ